MSESTQDRIRSAGEENGWTASDENLLHTPDGSGIVFLRDGMCTVVRFTASGAVQRAWQHPQDSWEILAETTGAGKAWQVICWLAGAPEPLRAGQKVRIEYPNPVLWLTYRTGTVVQDDGGEKILVSWRAADGPKAGRNVVLYHGAVHEQRIPRERVIPAGGH